MRHHVEEAIPGGKPSVSSSREKAALRWLIGGFVLITVLLGLDGLAGYRGATLVRKSVATLIENQWTSVTVVDEIQKTQSDLSLVQYRLRIASGPGERVQLKNDLESIEQTLLRIFSRISASDLDWGIWREIEEASSSTTSDVDRVLGLPAGVEPDLRRLSGDRERLSAATTRLIRVSHERAESSRKQIEGATHWQSIEDRLLLIGCLLVAGVFLWTATRIYYRMNEQSEELNRVSWQLLEKQELLARRLSRDLHDELGQSLTALKTNFTRHSSSSCVDPSWMQDCTQLLKDSILSAHEISQLLRPPLLDDFGLDSALAWLCEKFEERNRIEVNYVSDFRDRLDEQTETHLFRIAQEALTNVARHAGASSVQVCFTKACNIARLEISDNGTGLVRREEPASASFGLTGMRARARSLHGEMQIRSAPGRGTAIEVTFPLQETGYEEANPHLVG